MELAVIIPTLNERDNIERLLGEVLQADPRLHAIIVDDGSRDGTPEIVRHLIGTRNPEPGTRIHLIERGKKLGYASAVQDGMRFALQHGAQLILQMDADFSHDPKYLPALLHKQQTENLDLTIGSRYIPGGGTENWGWDRKVLSAGANALARRLLAIPARDCTGGYRVWKRELIERTGILNVKVEGYAFLFITLDRVARSGARIGEVPIIFVDRRFGHSKMSRRIVLEAMRVLFRLALRRWLRRT